MKLRVLVAAAAAVLLGGCGSVHPGAAAVVGDTTISMGSADDTAAVYCRLSLLSRQQVAPISNADVRRQAVNDLVLGVVARRLATQEDINPSPSSYEMSSAQRGQIADAMPGQDADEVAGVIESAQRTYAIAQAIGARVTGADPDAKDADLQALQQAGLKKIRAEVTRSDVSIDPRFGMAADGSQVATSGSLSVPAKALTAAEQKGLPATQQCAR